MRDAKLEGRARLHARPPLPPAHVLVGTTLSFVFASFENCCNLARLLQYHLSVYVVSTPDSNVQGRIVSTVDPLLVAEH